MIRITRATLPATLADHLLTATTKLRATTVPHRHEVARRQWKNAASIRKPISEILSEMAPGRRQCMYCGDSLGTDIDHFEPIARNPLRTFDWLNHLLACNLCNSHHKRDLFPVDHDGQPLLIDPTSEDPFDHLQWTWIGEYRPLTDKGKATIEVCGLNRSLLVKGREQARSVVIMALNAWWFAYQNGDNHGMSEAVLTVRQQPCADVGQAMLRHATLPGANLIFAQVPDTLRLLRMPEIRTALLTS